MKDTKKTTTPKKDFKDKTPKTEPKAPVVKEVKVVQEPVKPEEGDNKLVIIIALAVLVIVGTIIGLLVGCNRQDAKEPKKPAEDVVIPVEKDDDIEENVKVVKTSTSTASKKYQVTYLLEGKKVKTTKIAKGNKTSKITPAGYENCTYYADKAMTKKFDFKQKITGDTKVYLSCHLKEYSVYYYDNGVLVESYLLKGKEADHHKIDGLDKDGFLGWATSSDSKVVKYKAGKTVNLTSDLELYAVFGETTVTYKVVQVDPEFNVETEPLDNTDAPVLDEIEVAVEDVNEYELPDTPADAEVTTPTYFIPTEETNPNHKKVVADDKEELEDNEIRISDVNVTPDWYVPEVDDNVEEKEMEFKGFTTNETGETKKADENYEVSTTKENVVEVNFAIPEEDATEPGEPI